jgi:putative PEP-CTERM system histidine kinase
MKVGNELTGIITLNDDRVGQAPLSIEDQDLLRAYSTQLAVGLLQIRLSEKQQEAREIESFQYVSTFLIHDLKNLSSSLSLTVQNLPVHFDNPEFRADALKVISQSVSRIGEMCGRLSILRQRIEPKMQRSDLNELAEKVSEEFSSSLNGTLQKSLRPLPPVTMDPEQVRNVLTNLLLNAGQAIKSGGNIRISTERRADYGVISVSDDGCGMSQEFIEKSLFRPFRTTKSKGMGIGLFQCKMIIDAHKGRIEVESHEGEGSTFRVFLPLAPNGPTDSISSREANRSDRTQTSSVKQGT